MDIALKCWASKDTNSFLFKTIPVKLFEHGETISTSSDFMIVFSVSAVVGLKPGVFKALWMQIKDRND